MDLPTIGTIVTSICLTSSVFGLIWIHRRYEQLRSPFGIFGAIIVLYAAWNFFSPCATLQNEIMLGAFIMGTTFMNAFSSGYSTVNLGVNRRVRQDKKYNSNNRRTNEAIKLKIGKIK